MITGRYRERKDLHNGLPVVYYSLAPPNCAITPAMLDGGTEYTGKFGTLETMTDAVVPNYHSRVKKGEVFFNPLYRTRKVVNPPIGDGAQVRDNRIRCAGYPTQHYAVYGRRGPHLGALLPVDINTGLIAHPNFIVGEADISDMVAELSTRVLADRGKFAESNLYESVAQANQLASLLPGMFKDLRKALDHATRSYKPNAFKALKHVSGLYLATRYGLLPIMSDIETVVTGLEKHKDASSRITTRTRRTLTGADSSSFTIIHGVHTSTIRRNFVENTVVSVMSLDEAKLSLADRTGFSVKNALVVGWELIPWSFVADWVVNIGDRIGSLVPSPGLKQLGTCTVVHRELIWSYTASGTTAGSTWDVERPLTGVVSGVVETKRRVAGIAAPTLKVKADFRLDNVIRVLDATALLVQILSRR